MSMWPDDATQPLLSDPEPRWARLLGLAAMAALCAVFFAMHALFNVEAHPGVDQNGYLVGGKVLARHGTGGLSVIDPRSGQVEPYQFVGRMWIGADLGTDHERYYPKYPPGLPFFVAIGWWLGVPWLAYWWNPVFMTLGLAATFFLCRMLAGTTLALLGTAVVATSPTILILTTNPNSHAGALGFATWGMVLALHWTRHGGWANAIAAGWCLGMAVTFRYTEGLLAASAGLAVLFGLRWRDPRSWLQAAGMAAAWLVVVGAMVGYNLAAFGSVTGYDPTNESTGFRWAFFLDNWNTMLRALDGPGLFLIFPVAVAGMIGLLFWRLRVGLVMAAWILPSVLLYTAYYWAPSPEGMGYTRFFVTQFPALAACAAAATAVIAHASTRRGDEPSTATHRPRAAWTLAAGCVAALAIAANVATARPQLELDQINRLTLEDQTRLIIAQAPPGSVIISRNQSLLHHLQFVGEYTLYTGEQFDQTTIRRLHLPDEEVTEPQPFQPQRRLALYERLNDFDQRALNAEQHRLIDAAMDDGRRVFVAVPWRNLTGRDAEQFGMWRTLPVDRYVTKLAVQWERPAIGRLGDPTPATPRHRWNAMRPPTWRTPGSDRGLLVEVTRKATDPAPTDAADDASQQARR